MENIEKIIKFSNKLNLVQVDRVCDYLLNTSSYIKEDLINNINDIDEKVAEEIIKLAKIPYYIKHTGLNQILTNIKLLENTNINADANADVDTNTDILNQIKLNFIEDWKQPIKINIIKLVISLGFANKDIILYLIGSSSKKTYISGDYIDVNSLAIKKFFNNDFTEYQNLFYKKLDKLNQICSNNNDYELVKSKTNLMVKIIQSEIALREKYKLDPNIFYEYKIKIEDIIYTRQIENLLFIMFYKKFYYKILNDPKHPELKFITNNTWIDTKAKYLWLTELITFINNDSPNSKDYLISNIGIRNFDGVGKKVKCNLIKEIVQILNLNASLLNQIIDFIFDIGNNFKHQTYIKWYYKEKDLIDIFEKHLLNNISLIENLNNIIENLNLDQAIKTELLDLMMEYHSKLLDI